MNIISINKDVSLVLDVFKLLFMNDISWKQCITDKQSATKLIISAPYNNVYCTFKVKKKHTYN